MAVWEQTNPITLLFCAFTLKKNIIMKCFSSDSQTYEKATERKMRETVKGRKIV